MSIQKKLRTGVERQNARETFANGISSNIKKGVLYVGGLGSAIENGEYSFGDGMFHLRNILQPPTIFEVASVANHLKADYLSVSRYSAYLKFEIALLPDDFRDDPNLALDAAFHLSCLLKLIKAHNLFCPAGSSVSWDLVSVAQKNSVDFMLLDDFPRRIEFVNSDVPMLDSNDLKWAESYFENGRVLRNKESSGRFGLAFNLYYSWNHTQDMRIALSNLWIGLEALFGKKKDRPVKRMLVERICDWLPSEDARSIGDLYEKRCDAVHGRKMNGQEMGKILMRTHDIFRASLMCTVTVLT
ncbi:MAG: hypothetical protein HQK87_01590 [Nitrospinae bacterium]|nr:hypothetical protein [Nitrospinota bacterium]